MNPENSFTLPPDALERRARTLVARIRVKAHTKHLPRFEGMGQHEQLGFSVGRGADGRAGQPRVADLTDIGAIPSVSRVSPRPRPTLHGPQARRPDDHIVLAAAL